MTVLAKWLQHEADEIGRPYLVKGPNLDEIMHKYELRKKSRRGDLVDKKRFFSWFMRENIKDKKGHKMPFSEVGKLINKDHATIIYHCRRHEELMRQGDKLYISNTAEISRDLNRYIFDNGNKIA